MTAPLLATRYALAEVLRKHTLLGDVCRCGWDGEEHSEIHAEHVADALAGVVRDPASIADAVEQRLGFAEEMVKGFRTEHAVMAVVGEVRAALAAALTEDPS